MRTFVKQKAAGFLFLKINEFYLNLWPKAPFILCFKNKYFYLYMAGIFILNHLKKVPTTNEH